MKSSFRAFIHSLIISAFLLAGPTAPVVAQQTSAYVTDQASFGYAREINRGRQLIDSLMKAQHIPGVQVGVSVDGEAVWSEGFGYADVEERIPLWPNTKMRIGSVSKTLTSAAVGKLVEAGKLDLDKPVQAYVPYFPKKKYTITTRELAGHVAGIRHYRGDEFLSNKFYPTVKAGIAIFSDDTLLSKPGEKFKYSSYGWNLIGAVVEGAADENFLDFMREQVFRPLGMTNTVAEYMDHIIYHRSSYYEKNKKGQLQNAPHVDNSYKWASGGFIGTADDLLKFGNAMLGNRYLHQETMDMLWKSQKTNDGKPTHYGIGWRSGTDSEGRHWVGHSGGSVGGTTQFVMFPKQNVVVAVISNLSDVSYGDLHLQIADLFMQHAPEMIQK